MTGQASSVRLSELSLCLSITIELVAPACLFCCVCRDCDRHRPLWACSMVVGAGMAV